MSVTRLHPKPSIIPRLVPGSEAWLRQRYVNASYAGVLFGCHPFCTMADLTAMRRGEHRDEAGEAAATGIELEDTVAQRWAAKEGVTVVEPEGTYVWGPLSANPDRLIVGCTDTILQVKTTSHTEGPVPSYHWWQVQAEMYCTGAKQAVLAYFFGGSMCFREYVVARDGAAITDLLREAESFLAALDLGLDPTPVERSAADPTIELGEAEAALARELALLNEAKNHAEKEGKRIKALLDAAVGGPGLAPGSRAVLTHQGKPLMRLRRQRGREKTTGTGEYGSDYSVLEGI